MGSKEYRQYAAPLGIVVFHFHLTTCKLLESSVYWVRGTITLDGPRILMVGTHYVQMYVEKAVHLPMVGGLHAYSIINRRCANSCRIRGWLLGSLISIKFTSRVNVCMFLCVCMRKFKTQKPPRKVTKRPQSFIA